MAKAPMPFWIQGRPYRYSACKMRAGCLASRQTASIFKRQIGCQAFGSNLHLAPYTSGVWNTPSRAVSAYIYPFKTMTMGGMSIANPPIEVTDGRNFLGRDFASLLLGNDVLSHFHLTIAYREQKLYVTDAEAH